MKAIKSINIFAIFSLLIFSCDKEEDILQTESAQVDLEIGITLVNEKLKFESKESLKLFVDQSEQSKIKSKVEEFTEKALILFGPFSMMRMTMISIIF